MVRVVKMRLPASSSRATVNLPPPDTVQRTDPTKSEVSVRGEHLVDELRRLAIGCQRDLCLFQTSPPCINRHITVISSPVRLRIAAPVLIPPSCRRAGKITSLTGGLVPRQRLPAPDCRSAGIHRRGHLRRPARIRSPGPPGRGWKRSALPADPTPSGCPKPHPHGFPSLQRCPLAILAAMGLPTVS